MRISVIRAILPCLCYSVFRCLFFPCGRGEGLKVAILERQIDNRVSVTQASNFRLPVSSELDISRSALSAW